jgi:hypothetical protein
LGWYRIHACGRSGYTGIDWDHSIINGKIDEEINKHVKLIDSYTEISPSKKGMKTIVRGKLPGKGHHGERIGVFDNTRYFAITGLVLSQFSKKIEPRQEELNQLVKTMWPKDFDPQKPVEYVEYHDGGLSDSEIIEKALSANDGGRFRKLWDGDASDYRSPSEADQSLCFKLAFWTGKDATRIDSLFRQSGLMREKWDREDYRRRTIESAVEIVGETYSASSKQITIKTVLNPIIETESKRHGDVIRAVECYIDEDETGTFSIRDCYESILHRNSGIVERETVRKTLARFAREKSKIVADSSRRGWYRKIRQVREEIDFVNSTSQYLKMYLPFHLDQEVKISHGNIIVISGVTNMGKTTVALDMIANNMHKFEIHYFNDEMEGGELRERINLFEDIPGGPKSWKMKSWRLPDFEEIPDVIVQGKGVINFLDYIDPPADKPYVIKDMMKRIHKRLDGAVAVICLQLKPGAEAPSGGWGAIHRSRLAINIERNVVKVIKAKARTSYEWNINGLHKNFDIIGGWRIVEQSKWLA